MSAFPTHSPAVRARAVELAADLGPKRAADALGISSATVRVWAHRARSSGGGCDGGVGALRGRRRSGGRYPLSALLDGGDVAQLARSLGVCDSTVRRRLERGLDELEADAWAMALGLHPLEVWPDWA